MALLYTLSAPTVSHNGATIILSKQLASNSLKTIRTALGKRLGVINTDPLDADRSRADPYQVYCEARDTLSFARKALTALRAEIHQHEQIIAALKSGALPANAPPAVACAAETYHLVQKLTSAAPNSSLGEELEASIAIHEDTLAQLQQCEKTAAERYTKSEYLLTKSAQSSFCFNANISGLIEQGVDKHLPDEWRDLILPNAEYGQADFDPWASAANINSSVLQTKFRHLLEEDLKVKKVKRYRAYRNLDESEIRAKLAEATA